MPLTPIFQPIPQSATVATVAGSGNVQRWQYTVPAGKRAVLTHVYVAIFASAAAANTTAAIISATIGGVAIEVVRFTNAAVIATTTVDKYQPYIDLGSGDTVQFNTINTAAVNSTMLGSAVIREYF